MVTDERKEAARESIEKHVQDFIDVYAGAEAGDEPELHLPVLRAWVFITVHDDAIDPSIGATYRMVKANQGMHESVGLLHVALIDYARDEW